VACYTRRLLARFGARVESASLWFAASMLLFANDCDSSTNIESQAVVAAQAGAAQSSVRGLNGQTEPTEGAHWPKRPAEHMQTRAERLQFIKSLPSYREKFARQVPIRSASEARWHFIQVGDGWGCGKHVDDSYECWSVARDSQPESTIVAQRVPWLDGKHLIVGPDRACVYEGDWTAPYGSQWRCWRAPEFLLRGPDATLPPDRNESWVVAGEPFSEAKFMHDVMPVTHGAAVGCTGRFCWGSASAVVPKPMCEADGLRLPCALVDEATLRDFANNDTAASSGEEFIVGDLFACRGYADRGLYCVGASRDGLFGNRDACPPGLRSTWPSSRGPIAAPNATCARSPVLVDGAPRHSGVFGSASPSGFCLSVHRNDDWFPLCFGGIPAPIKGWPIIVGLSERPSACSLDDSGKLYCWGEGYSRDAAGKAPVRVHRSPALLAVAWDDNDPTLRDGAIRENCGRTVRPLPACAPDTKGLTPSELNALAEGFEGTRVSVRGELKLIDNDVLVTNSEQNVALEGSWCHGDASRICCSLPVLGQAVMVSGVFSWREARRWGPEAWMIKDAALCEVKADPPFTLLKAPNWPAPSLSLR
jgi:hypothetical protein